MVGLEASQTARGWVKLLQVAHMPWGRLTQAQAMVARFVGEGWSRDSKVDGLLFSHGVFHKFYI